MKKLTSKFVQKYCYFILYDYIDDDKLLYYFDSFDELSKYLNYECKYLVHKFNVSNSYVLPVCISKFCKKFYLHLFIDEELVAQNRETI